RMISLAISFTLRRVRAMLASSLRVMMQTERVMRRSIADMNAALAMPSCRMANTSLKDHELPRAGKISSGQQVVGWRGVPGLSQYGCCGAVDCAWPVEHK